LVLKGVPPRLENIGFIYPPLPVFIAGLFNGNALLAQSLVSSLISAFIGMEVLKGVRSPGLAASLIGFLTLSFPVLFLATQRFDLYLYFFLLIVSMKYLYQYVKNEYSLHLFLSGPFFGMTFFTHFSSLYLIPMFFIMIFLLYRTNLRKFTAVSLVFFTPYLIFMGIFSYINWVFTSEAFGYLRNYILMFSNPDTEAVVSSGDVLGSLAYSLKYVFQALPVLAPCLLGVFYDRRLVAAVPFIIIFSFVYSNLFFPAIHASAIFIIFFLVMTEFGDKLKPGLLIAALCISLLSSPLLALVSAERHEKGFARAFWGDFDRNMAGYQKAAALLRETEGKILLDDAGAYPLIYCLKSPERFILPYQYEYTPALTNPAFFATYVVALKDRNRDSLYQLFEGGIKGFHPVFDDGTMIIWGKT
jgi:hypothetical protein